MGDFSPIFSTIKSWNQFEALVHLIIGVNDVMGQLENKFTVGLIFDKSLLSVYETNFKIKIPNSNDFQTATINFSKVCTFQRERKKIELVYSFHFFLLLPFINNKSL